MQRAQVNVEQQATREPFACQSHQLIVFLQPRFQCGEDLILAGAQDILSVDVLYSNQRALAILILLAEFVLGLQIGGKLALLCSVDV